MQEVSIAARKSTQVLAVQPCALHEESVYSTFYLYTGMNQLFRYYAGFLWIFVSTNIPLQINLLLIHK